MMTYRQVADHVKLRQMSGPQDDWFPELYMLRASGLRREAIDPSWFADRGTKGELFGRLIPALIRVGGVRVVALTLVMYVLRPEHPMAQVIAEREKENPDGSPTAGLPYFQNVEGSIEMLFVHVFDAERHEGWAAEITRPGRGRPALGPFELIGGPDQMTGALPDPIRAALR